MELIEIADTLKILKQHLKTYCALIFEHAKALCKVGACKLTIDKKQEHVDDSAMLEAV